MAKRKVGRNEPCPCGSGKKYKQCCWDKNFEWQVDEEGEIHRSVPISTETRQAFDEVKAKFKLVHGRDMKPNEYLFGDLGHPEYVEATTVDIMKRAGIPPALIYAHTRTGRIVTEQNKSKLPDVDIREWDEAIDEYHRRVAAGDTPDI